MHWEYISFLLVEQLHADLGVQWEQLGEREHTLHMHACKYLWVRITHIHTRMHTYVAHWARDGAALIVPFSRLVVGWRFGKLALAGQKTMSAKSAETVSQKKCQPWPLYKYILHAYCKILLYNYLNTNSTERMKINKYIAFCIYTYIIYTRRLLRSLSCGCAVSSFSHTLCEMLSLIGVYCPIIMKL